MKDITIFVNDVLCPIMYEKVQSLFPEMDFKPCAVGWKSPKNIDGTDPDKKRTDKSVITKNQPHRILENGEGGPSGRSKSLIDLYMDLNLLSFIDAVTDIARNLCVDMPETNAEQAAKYEEYRQKQECWEQSLQRQRKALYMAENKDVLDYLHRRGWSDEDIRLAELGCIGRAESEMIGAQYSVGVKYKLSIPLRSEGKLYGFKFRTILPDVQPKYLNLKDIEKRLFGLTGINQHGGDIIVVEGELDALHAKVKGISNVVSVTGGGMTENLLQAAKNRGITRITLLLDNDKAGETFIQRSVEAADIVGLTTFVASLTDAKDVDEYLKTHSADDLKEIIAKADTAYHYLFKKIVAEAVKDQGGEGEILPDKDFYIMKDKIIALANKAPDLERDIILSDFSKCTGDAITKETLLAVADRQREMDDALKQKEETYKALSEVKKQADKGNIVEAINLMKEASAALTLRDSRALYSQLITLPTEAEILGRLKEKKGSIPTKYELSGTKGTENLSIPSGAITFFCAQTSHGKSMVLQNIALQAADTEGEGTVLYYTFEEDRDSILMQMLNKFVGVELCRNYSKWNNKNMSAIEHYFRTGSDQYIRDSEKPLFHEKRRLFFDNYILNGKIRLIGEDYDSKQMIDSIRYICSQVPVKAVFIDYIQLIHTNGNRLPRNEELKGMCKALKDLAIQEDIPIVAAAQFNREAKSPIDMHPQNIAEAADLERIANKIIGIWNSSFKAQGTDNKKELQYFIENKMKLGASEPSKLKLEALKNRGGLVGIEAILDYNGTTGIVKPNAKTPPKAEADGTQPGPDGGPLYFDKNIFEYE